MRNSINTHKYNSVLVGKMKNEISSFYFKFPIFNKNLTVKTKMADFNKTSVFLLGVTCSYDIEKRLHGMKKVENIISLR